MALSLFKKKSQLNAVPDFPKGGASPSAVGLTPLKKGKTGLNKKLIIGVAALFSIALVALTTFIAIRNQPQTTKSNAAVNTCINLTKGQTDYQLCSDTIDNTTTSVIGHFHLHKTTGPDITVSVTQSSFYCTSSQTTSCQDNPNSTTVSLNLTTADTPFDIARSSTNNQACGSFEVDASAEGSAPTTLFYSTKVDCTPPPVPPGISTAPTATPTQAPGTNVISGRVYNATCPQPPVTVGACTPAGSETNGVTVDLQQGGKVLQSDITHDDTTVQGGSGLFTFYNLAPGTYSICVHPLTGTVMSCPTSPDSATCFSESVPPDNTNNIINLQDSSCITPAPISSVTPGSSPTPTDIVVVITATPTPASTGTPITPNPTLTGIVAQSTPAVTVTIPSAGNPLPYLAVGVPFLLILLAFIL